MYEKSFFITEPVSNNAFSFVKRSANFQDGNNLPGVVANLFPNSLNGQNPNIHEPRLFVPKLIEGCLEDVAVGDEVVFEDFADEKILRSCKGLKNFVRIAPEAESANARPRISAPIYIFDNHNHAFAFWHLEKLRNKPTDGNSMRGLLQHSARHGLRDGAVLVHIDGHKDARIPDRFLSPEDSRDPQKVFEYTNSVLNVGNFIPPAQKTGLIGEVIFVLSEKEIDEFDFERLKSASAHKLQESGSVPELKSGSAVLLKSAPQNLILDIDLDFFAPELDYISNEKKLALIKRLLPQARMITFATSPFFIEQKRAIEWLKKILD